MACPGARWVKRLKGTVNKPGRPGYFEIPISTHIPGLLKTLHETYGLSIGKEPPESQPTYADGSPPKTPARLIAESIDRLKARIKLSIADNSDIQLVSPEGLDYLPYQKAGIEYALNAGNALIADEPGLGKTIQAIGVSNALPECRRILVIPPASLKINWKREWEKWCAKGLKVARVQTGAANAWPTMDTRTLEQVQADAQNPDYDPDADAEGVNVVVVNYDLIEAHQSQIYGQQWDLMIVDEAHALKNQDTKRTKAVLGSGSGRNRKEGIPANRTLLLTGTPILNRPSEIWPLAHALAPDFFSDKYAFEKRYCNGHQTQYGWNAKGATNLKELQRELRSRIMVRRQKSQVLKDLPPKTRQLIELDAPEQAMARGQYRQLEAATKTLQDVFRQREQLRDTMKANPATDAQSKQAYQEQASRLVRESKIAFNRMALVRKETAFSKVPQVVELARTALDNGKLILFCHHQEVAEAYRDSLNRIFQKQAGRGKNAKPKTIAMVTGKTPEKERQNEADRFQDDPDCQVFIGSIQAAGTGLTLTAASTVLFAELDWVPGNVTQAEDRAHRIGQEDHVLIYHAVIEGTVDSLMVRRLIEKQNVTEAALDSPQATVQPKPRTPEERFADWCLKQAQESETAEQIDLVHNGSESPEAQNVSALNQN
jgi:SNF2 family DNA or RNA helicase